jgi:hypothetical protein
MFRSPRHFLAGPRRGVILLVVVALLTLFAIVGLSFVLYADSEARAARTFRESTDNNPPDVEPEALFSYFLGQLIYDVPDDDYGVFSAMRGHSLARLMYGVGSPNPSSAVTPFNGTGRLHTGPGTPAMPQAGAFPYNNPFNIDDWHLINYQFWATDNFLRDPERLGPGALTAPTWRPDLTTAPGPYTGGFNAPYTYPDLNNMFLAAVNTDGTVRMPSFHRHWLFSGVSTMGGIQYALNDPANPNWTNTFGKYLTLRPRPIDQKRNPLDPNEPTVFPYPEDPGGDVKNMVGAPNYKITVNGMDVTCTNDSIWMDLGAPVMTTSTGRKFKALFAPLIVDLDSRVNLNVVGNIRGTKTQGASTVRSHASNQGLGPWEISLRQVLDADSYNDNPTGPGEQATTREWVNLFLGIPMPPLPATPPMSPQAVSARLYQAPILQQPQAGTPPYSSAWAFTQAARYGGNPWASPAVYGRLTTLPLTFLPTPVQNYSIPIDADGCNESTALLNQPSAYGATGRITVNVAGSFSLFPTFPGAGFGNASTAELTEHPLVFNSYQPAYVPTGTPPVIQRTFPLSNMEALLRYGETGSHTLTSDLLRLCPLNFGGDPNSTTTPTTIGDAARRRRLVTTISQDLVAPGVVPTVFDPTATPYTLTSTPTPRYVPDGPLVGFPALSERANTAAMPDYSEFQIPTLPPTPGVPRNNPAADWRAVNAALGRLDLNRSLPDYPPPNATTGRFDLTNAAVSAAFFAAERARQQLANDIFVRLRAAVGARNPKDVDPMTNAAEFNGLRWLAQLAVNIVDFIDADDIMTPFQWSPTNAPTEFLYGTELPRLVLNEIYMQQSGTGGADVWVELYNTLNRPTASTPTASGSSDWGAAKLEMPASGTNTFYRIYRLVGTTALTPELRQPNNVRGVVMTSPATDLVTQFQGAVGAPVTVPYDGNAVPTTDNRFVLAQNGPPPLVPLGNDPTQTNKGFYLAGPRPLPAAPGVTTPPLTLTNTSMTIPPPVGVPLLTQATILLQRLACPYIDPADPNYPTNTYVTIDYMEAIPVNPTPVADDFTNNASWGKKQPFAGANWLVGTTTNVQVVKKQKGATPTMGQPNTTFFSANLEGGVTNNTPYTWLVHLDRPLINAMELLHVSGYRPHELTQEFINSSTPLSPQPVPLKPTNHRVPWFDEDIAAINPPPPPPGLSHRLYRAFEYLDVRSRLSGMQAPVATTASVDTTQTPAVVRITAAPGQPCSLSGAYASGRPWSIRPGDTVILDKGIADPNPLNVGLSLQENLVVQNLVYPDGFTTTTPVLKTHGATVTVTLTNMTDRIPGKINPNTIWDGVPVTGSALSTSATFSALCDPQTSNGFSQTDVDTIYTNIKAFQKLDGTDKPFLGLGIGAFGTNSPQFSDQQTGGFGLGNTFLRPAPTTVTAGTAPPQFFQVPSTWTTPTTAPYLKYELMTKLFGNLTPRSNVFAVWLTVGYFEVTDDTVRPVKLGQEIGRSENRQIRHRMFAIVDRTNLLLPQNAAIASAPSLPVAVDTLRQGMGSGMGQTAQVNLLAGTTQFALAPPIPGLVWTLDWNIQQGTMVQVGEGPKAEVVQVQAIVPGPGFQADFKLPHNPLEKVFVLFTPGNPGPQPRFRYTGNTAVVPYVSIVK